MPEPTPLNPDSDRDWFRSQVHPVVEAEPIADAWSVIEARAHGDVPAVAPTRSLPPRWVAIAAVLAVLAGLAVVVAATRPDNTDAVTTDQPGATGWYLPKGLPDGWKLRSAWVTKRPRACGTTTRRWEGQPPQGLRPTLELTYTHCASGEIPALPTSGTPGPALGHGVDETRLEITGTPAIVRQLSWVTDGGWTLSSQGISEDDLIAAARAIVARPASVAPPLEGLEIRQSGLANGPPPGPAVAVSLETPSGRVVSYRLAVPGTGPRTTPFTKDIPVEVPGQPLPVELRTPRFDDAPEGSPLGRCCDAISSSYLGDWPGADLRVPRSNFSSEAAGDPPANEEEWTAYEDAVLQLIGSLRPATATEWRAFLERAEKRPADRLFTEKDLAAATGTTRRSGKTTTTAPPTKTTATSRLTTTTADDGVRSYQSTSPGTPTPRPDEDDRLTPLEHLKVSLELEDIHLRPEGPSLTVGEVAPAKLIVENTSDEPVVLTECTLAFTRWGLVPADDRAAPLPTATDGTCRPFPEETVPARGTIRLPIDWSRPPGFVAQRAATDGSGQFLGTLDAGAYLATVEVPGRSSDVRLQIPVEVAKPPCPATDEDVADYHGLPASEARALAKERGLSLAMASLDGETLSNPAEPRCDRVMVDIWRSEVVNAWVG